MRTSQLTEPFVPRRVAIQMPCKHGEHAGGQSHGLPCVRWQWCRRCRRRQPTERGRRALVETSGQETARSVRRGATGGDDRFGVGSSYHKARLNCRSAPLARRRVLTRGERLGRVRHCRRAQRHSQHGADVAPDFAGQERGVVFGECVGQLRSDRGVASGAMGY